MSDLTYEGSVIIAQTPAALSRAAAGPFKPGGQALPDQATWDGWASNPRPRDYEAGKPGLFSCRLVTFLQVRAGAV